MTLNELKEVGQLSFPETKNVYYQRLLDSATALCLQECGLENATNTQYFNGGYRAYQLTYGPVSAIVSVTADGNILESTEYRLENKTNKLVITNGTPKGVENVVVVYSCIFVEDSLFKQAVAMTVQQLAKLNASKQVGVISRTVEGGTEQLDQKMLPEAVKAALNKYKRGFIV